MPTSDDYARATIRAGRDLGISVRGIKIGLATNIVEVGYPLKMYANSKVPESLKLPHDAVGSDGLSVGTFQQQIRRGTNGAWWWADAATCMDPYKSAVLFFQRLKALNYNDTTRSPGSFAQAVQGSAYPGRYDQRFSEASALYDRLAGSTATVATYYDSDRSAEFNFGGPRSLSSIVGICVHTTESGKAATANALTADSVVTYQRNSQSGSYHVMVGVDGKRIRENTDDWITWSTGNKGNNILLHICFVGNASQTRAEWLAQDRQLRAAATVVRYWSDKYKIPLRKVAAAGLPGILGHGDTRVWGGTDHTDPGPNFPYDVLISYANGSTGVTNEIDAEVAVAKAWIGDRITKVEGKTADGVGRYAHFTNGSIYWHPKVRGGKATAIPKAVMDVYQANDWERGPLGYPTLRHTVIAGAGDIQAFQGGVVYRKYGLAGFPVWGAIGGHWSKLGAERSKYGWPVGTEVDRGNTITQAFEHGSLSYDKTTRQVSEVAD
jgi:hypothetical protein